MRIHYKANIDDPNAILLMSPPQTTDDDFLLTLTCLIRARNIFPCQDTPAVKFSFNATIKTDPKYMVVMGASLDPVRKQENGVYSFTSIQPIPSYLFSLAVADLTYHSFDINTGVYAEPKLIQQSALEFAGVETMLSEAKKLFGESPWKNYKLLILPKNFPYGAMENTELTFMSAVAIGNRDAGMLAKLAHEIAHSWFGNWVTLLTWSDV